MADQREAVEMADALRRATYIRDTWTHEPTGMDAITLDLARAVIALDEECRRLRGGLFDTIDRLGGDTYAGAKWSVERLVDEARSIVDFTLERDIADGKRHRAEVEALRSARPAPSSPGASGASEPSEADVEAVARRLYGSMLFDIAQEPHAGLMRSVAREAIRLGARVPR